MDKFFGKKAKDKVTGFTGIVTGKVEWMYGCNQYVLTPQVKEDGTVNEANWFDEGRIEIIEDAINPDDVKVEKNGCDWSSMPKCR